MGLSKLFYCLGVIWTYHIFGGSNLDFFLVLIGNVSCCREGTARGTSVRVSHEDANHEDRAVR